MRCAGIVFSPIPTSACEHYDIPGVYMLCRREPDGVHILYVGQADSLAQRLGPSHPRWGEAMRRGMNEIHLHLLAKTETQRLAVERHVISRYFTPMNRGTLANALVAFAQGVRRGLAGMYSSLAARLADIFASSLPRLSFGLNFNSFRSR